MTVDGSLVDRFRSRAERHLPGQGPLVLAISGGLDSTVLLHLARFSGAVSPERLVVAHFDHRLRAGSAGDARWVAGLSRAWGLACHQAEAPETPGNEAHARRLRYAFLDRVRTEVGGSALLTAHHADDQAETVLFRVLRGTGVRGLRGMASVAPGSGRVRLLLPFWRRELETYARRARLTWRTDPTNLDLGRARNAIRHEILPLAESLVAPGARRSLVRLARHAARHETAWQTVEEDLLGPVLEAREEGRFILARPGLLAYDPAIRERLLRRLARELGVDLDEAGTRVAMEFTSRGVSGAEVHLAGGLLLRRAFDGLELVLGDASGAPESAPADGDPALQIAGPEAGAAGLRLAGRRLEVRWGLEPPPMSLQAAFRLGDLSFPLVVRGWKPGDRVRLEYGTKAVAKLLAEARVPRWERRGTVVVADAAQRVLWVPGVALGGLAQAAPDQGDFHIGVEDAHSQ